MSPIAHPSSQRGAALVVGLVLLVVVTLVAVSAIRNTSTQQKLATNMQERMTVYQTVESLIRQIVVNRISAPLVAGQQHILTQAQTAGVDNPVAIAMDDPPPGLTGSADFSFTGTGKVPGYSIDDYAGLYYLIDATADMAAANSQANNRQGMVKVVPAGF